MSKKRTYEPKKFVSCVSVSPTQVNFYSRPEDGFRFGHRFHENIANLDDNDHEGKISYKARKKMEMALGWLLFNAKPKRIYDELLQKHFTFKVNFITLTLPSPQQHPDQEINSVCLNNFLTVARKKGLKNYVWRAEAQPSTGNIHFHIITDMYLHYEDIRRWWNQSTELLGYVSTFQAKHGHRDPNSTDVHSVKHVRKLASYLSKYCCKNRSFGCVGELRRIKGEVIEVMYNSFEYHSENAYRKKGQVIGHILSPRIRPIQGRLWGCSQSLSNKKTLKFNEIDHPDAQFFQFVQESDFYRCQGQWCDSWFGDVGKEAEEWMPQLYTRMVDYVNS